MLLKTSSKTFKERVKNYIIDKFNDWYEENKDYINPVYEAGLKTGGYSFIKNFIIKVFIEEKLGYNIHGQDLLNVWYHDNLYEAFKDWCQGLPSIIDTNYYLHRAVDYIYELRKDDEDLKAIPSLEMKQREIDLDHERIETLYGDESGCEEYLTQTLYKELFKNIYVWQIRSMYKNAKPFKRI